MLPPFDPDTGLLPPSEHVASWDEVQVQRYEAAEYRSASLARICDVATKLGVDIAETAQLRTPSAA